MSLLTFLLLCGEAIRPPLAQLRQKGGWLLQFIGLALFVSFSDALAWLLCNYCLGLMRQIKERGYQFGYKYKIVLKIEKHFFTEEEHIMKGVRFQQAHDYICKCDKDLPKDEQVVFQCRYLTAQEQADLRDMMYSVSGFGEKRSEKFLTGSSALMALRKGLKGWKNFNFMTNGSGESKEELVPFNEENFSCIPPEERDELANHIRGISEEEMV